MFLKKKNKKIHVSLNCKRYLQSVIWLFLFLTTVTKALTSNLTCHVSVTKDQMDFIYTENWPKYFFLNSQFPLAAPFQT